MENNENVIEPDYYNPLIKNYGILYKLMENQIYLTIRRSRLLKFGFDINARTHTEVIKGKHIGCVKEFAIIKKRFSFPASYKIIDLSFYK